MLSQQQFSDATNFIKSYRDALNCVEQIAERRQAYKHYEETAGNLVSGVQQNQLKVENGNIKGGDKKADFNMVRAFDYSKELWTQHGLNMISNRDDFNSRLDTACGELDAPLNL